MRVEDSRNRIQTAIHDLAISHLNPDLIAVRLSLRVPQVAISISAQKVVGI